MPLARLLSAAFWGIEALLIEVEVDLTTHKSASGIRLVGLPDAAVKESKDRVLHAIKNSGFSTETLSCMIHLAPAEMKKVGAFYDLPIALGILQGMQAFTSEHLNDYLIGGELGLSGELRPIVGALSFALLAKKLGKKGVLLPYENAQEAACVSGVQIVALAHLREALAFFKNSQPPYPTPLPAPFSPPTPVVDMQEIKGQLHAKRALEIAAAGGHNILMCGPPGTGKTLLAKAFSGILPPLSLEEALEVTAIHSLAGLTKALVRQRPFRAPHHTISFAGMVGGGAHPKPGEITLAHRGVLFLDELAEFNRSTLEVLRQPLEDKNVTISRAGGKVFFPTDFICIAAMNPCPCGYLGHPNRPCSDSHAQIYQYRKKISGPLLDRIDIHVEMPPLSHKEMLSSQKLESSAAVGERVTAAYTFKKMHTSHKASLNRACQAVMQEAMENLSISSRAFTRIVGVAQTIAALSSRLDLIESDLLEALSYRFTGFLQQ